MVTLTQPKYLHFSSVIRNLVFQSLTYIYLHSSCTLLFRELILNMWDNFDQLASRDVIGHVTFDSP